MNSLTNSLSNRIDVCGLFKKIQTFVSKVEVAFGCVIKKIWQISKQPLTFIQYIPLKPSSRIRNLKFTPQFNQETQ